ncbi:bromodomain containing 8 isoform X2 [Arctopsyche grandis]|uniref:bromodomain containing 8 isoform X2 n=1 Tax=Arctopsyche grandis TaxID=121162 RepID=UPI00406D82D9
MSVQEKVVVVKRAPLDPWSKRELLWLVCAVSRNGDQNWVSVCRALRSLAAEGARPQDWFTQRTCAAQYGALLERAEPPRNRKKRAHDGAAPSHTPPHPANTDTPLQTILKRLTQDRVAELQKILSEDKQTYDKTKDEVKELLNNPSDSRVRAMAAALETHQRLRQRELAKQTQWLREREDRKSENSWRRPESDIPHSSPLLTSLLQSSVPVNQITPTEHIPPTIPTIPILIDKVVPEIPVTTDDSQSLSTNKIPNHGLQKLEQSKSERLKIEQIKSELQKIEQSFIANSNTDSDSVLNILPQLHSVSSTELPIIKDPPATESKSSEKIEIDDIEIKAEDVYAFSDIDLDIPPVSSIHKSSIEDVQSTEQDDLPGSNESVPTDNLSDISPSDMTIAADPDEMPKPTIDTNTVCDVSSQEQIVPDAFDSKSSEKSADTSIKAIIAAEIALEIKTEEANTPAVVNPEEEDSDSEMNQSVSELKKDLDAKKNQDSVDENPEPIISDTKENVTVDVPEIPQETSTSEDLPATEIVDVVKTVEQLAEESHSEMYDDAPMEVVREDKPGKKRDYSRKKTEKEERPSPIREIESIPVKSEFNDEIGSDNSQESSDKKLLSRKLKSELSGSRSESPATPVDSLPNSPAPATPPSNSSHNTSHSTSEQDKDYRIWKKSVSLALNRLCALKYASLFLRPITDEQAPGYSQAIKKPMDLSTIRRNIDLGVIKTTQEFHRDVLLMLTNALMYNRTDHRVYTMAQDTIREAISEINLLLQAQAHAAAQTPTLSRLTRPPRPASRSAGTPLKRKRGGGSDTPTSKKRRVDEN